MLDYQKAGRRESLRRQSENKQRVRQLMHEKSKWHFIMASKPAEAN
ncbi:hypothetical protein ACLBW0_10430 [Enterobacteriaceae bacterium C34A]